jgi:hypothetical protein
MKKLCFFTAFFAVGILLCQLDNCVAAPRKQYIKDGKEYGKVRGAFRHRWWNYYERGLSFAEGEFYREAVSDLKEAVDQRFEDKRMARTYGMHFVDYFPHREMGVVYFLMGDYDAAKKELILSLEQEPSAKAHYYLDKVRRGLMKSTRAAVSIPHLFINLPSDEIWTKADTVLISGIAKDEQFISKITLAGKPFFIESAQQEVEFEKEFRFEQGKHVIKIVAENLLGGQVESDLRFHVDRQGPVISLEPYPSEGAAQKQIQGFLYDESGEITLSIDGIPVTVPRGEDVPFNAPIRPGTEQVLLVAKDKVGNETQARVDVQGMSTRGRYPMLAARDFGRTISDAGGFDLAVSFSKKDTQEPSIKLRGWPDEQTVFLKRVYIEGEVRDESEIVGLIINETPVLRRKGRMIFFNHPVELAEGKNTVTIEVTDKAGNTSVKEIVIIRQIPKVFQTGSRFSIALLPLENKGMADTGLIHMFEDLLMVSFMDQNRFQIIERQRLDTILQEQKLSRTKLIDEETALKVGRLLAARGTLVGNFLETKIGIEVVARLIDNETSEVMAVKDAYYEFKDRAGLMTLAESLAIKFHREFPLVDGIIIQKKGKSVFTDLGKDKAKPERRLIVYREGEPVRHPVTGKSLGCDTEIIGYARITQVMDQMSTAMLINGLKEETIRIQDKVMTE